MLRRVPSTSCRDMEHCGDEPEVKGSAAPKVRRMMGLPLPTLCEQTRDNWTEKACQPLVSYCDADSC